MDLKNNGRLWSLDALRGADMCLIMGVPAILSALCVLVGARPDDVWICRQMKHVIWDGFRIMDCVFPVFMFISGVSFPFSCAKSRERGLGNGALTLKILKRAALMFLVGVFYEGIVRIDLGWESFRYGSVLGRIGIAWAAAALLYVFCSVRTRCATAAALLVGYWLLLRFVPAPDALTAPVVDTQEYRDIIAQFGYGPFSLPGNLSGYLDRTLLPGRMRFPGVFDSQGTLSTLPSIVLPMLGMFAGDWVRRADLSGNRKVFGLLAAAAVSACAGLLFSLVMPINKSLWSSSFILCAGAVGLAAFAAFYWIVDVRMYRSWTFFFRVIGMNSITIFILQRFNTVKGGYTAFSPLRALDQYLFTGVANLLPPAWGSLLMAVSYMAVCWGVLYFLYRKNIFFKI